MSSHRATASAIYTDMQAMIRNMVGNDVTAEREKIADALLGKLTDYSWHRYAAGCHEQEAMTEARMKPQGRST